MSLLRAGQGDPRCPAEEGESWGVYIPRLARFLRLAEPLPEARLPYREPGEEDEPWVPTRTVTREDLAVKSADGPWEDR